jgi:hypothetical protein
VFLKNLKKHKKIKFLPLSLYRPKRTNVFTYFTVDAQSGVDNGRVRHNNGAFRTNRNAGSASVAFFFVYFRHIFRASFHYCIVQRFFLNKKISFPRVKAKERY